MNTFHESVCDQPVFVNQSMDGYFYNIPEAELYCKNQTTKNLEWEECKHVSVSTKLLNSSIFIPSILDCFFYHQSLPETIARN